MPTLVRERMKFSLLNGSEEADCSWSWFSTTGSGSDLEAGIAAQIDSLWTGIRGVLPDSTSVASHNLDILDISDGKVTATFPAPLPSPNTGSNTSGSIPAQCATVVSIRTASVGPSARGRFYLPAVGQNQLNTSGLLQTTPQHTLANTWAAYFDAIHAAEPAWHVGVFSRVHASFAPAVSIDVGTVIDTQRRRRSGLVEARFSVPLT